MNFEINITSYKYPDCVNNLINQLRNTLRSPFIRVWDNSPENPLSIRGCDELRWNRFNPSLSRVWNWAIGQTQTPWVMITNDDIFLSDNWLAELQEDFGTRSNALWHGPSRCFLFHRSLIECVGWFDERLTGFTYEDLDYVRRMNAMGIDHSYGEMSSLHVNAKSLKHELNREAHPIRNKEFMEVKYDEGNLEQFNAKPIFGTPDFYPCRE